MKLDGVRDDHRELRESIRRRVENFSEFSGRRPRILVARLGQSCKDMGFTAAAKAYADLGFDVDISPFLRKHDDVIQMAIDNDVHVIVVTYFVGDHLQMIAEMAKDLKRVGRKDLFVAGKGRVLPGDSEYLYEAGIELVCAMETPVIRVADKILAILEEKKNMAFG